MNEYSLLNANAFMIHKWHTLPPIEYRSQPQRRRSFDEKMAFRIPFHRSRTDPNSNANINANGCSRYRASVRPVPTSNVYRYPYPYPYPYPIHIHTPIYIRSVYLYSQSAISK